VLVAHRHREFHDRLLGARKRGETLVADERPHFAFFHADLQGQPLVLDTLVVVSRHAGDRQRDDLDEPAGQTLLEVLGEADEVGERRRLVARVAEEPAEVAQALHPRLQQFHELGTEVVEVERPDLWSRRHGSTLRPARRCSKTDPSRGHSPSALGACGGRG